MAMTEAEKRRKAAETRRRRNDESNKRKLEDAAEKNAADARKRQKDTESSTVDASVVGTGIYLEPSSSLKTGYLSPPNLFPSS